MTKAYLLGALHDGTVKRLTYHIGQKESFFKDEDIVHASSNRRISMNKVSLAEAGDGSPPF